MYVTNNDTAAPISLSPPRFGERRGGAAAADNRVRRRPKRADTRRAGAPRGRARDPAAEQADEETIRRWELLHARHLEYRGGVPRLEEGMRKAAPEHWPDRRFTAFVPEMEETGEKVDDDPTPELEAARGESRDASVPVE
jgi:hypothetical protein